MGASSEGLVARRRVPGKGLLSGVQKRKGPGEPASSHPSTGAHCGGLGPARARAGEAGRTGLCLGCGWPVLSRSLDLFVRLPDTCP